MKLDAQVSKIKFDQEVKLLSAQSATTKKWGVVIHEISYPSVKVIFIPRNTLKFSLPVTTLNPGKSLLPGFPTPPPGIKNPLGANMQLLHTNDIPSLSARAFGVNISLDDFDQRAPSVVFCDPFTWREIPYANLFRANHVGDNNKAFNVILDQHPITKKPFMCMRGIREYHDHPQHTGDDWMLYRKHYGLFSTIQTIWKTCVLNANPHLILYPNKLEVNWGVAGVPA